MGIGENLSGLRVKPVRPEAKLARYCNSIYNLGSQGTMDGQTGFQEKTVEIPGERSPQNSPRSNVSKAPTKEGKRAPKKAKNRTRSEQNTRENFVSEVPANAIPFEKALKLLQEAKVPDLASRTSLWRAFHAGRLPGYVKGKNRLFFKPEPLFELIGHTPAYDISVDQALIRHFEASEFNTPITAMMAGIVGNLGKAHQVFKDWIKMKNDPDVAARIEAKARADAAKIPKVEEPPPSTTCDSCGRSPEQADKDDADVNFTVTGHSESPNASEMRALAEFRDQKCTGCWKWLPSAPTASMQARLRVEKT
ncbi:MAG TPA: hypothetical protein VFA98_07525 [Thermoanaerobaculia bacterium]|nr:hypothetical protein [Thermoanaerobaculia bacterium]